MEEEEEEEGGGVPNAVSFMAVRCRPEASRSK